LPMNTLTITFAELKTKNTNVSQYGVLASDNGFVHGIFRDSWADFDKEFPSNLSIIEALHEPLCFDKGDYIVEDDGSIKPTKTKTFSYGKDDNGKHLYKEEPSVFEKIIFIS